MMWHSETPVLSVHIPPALLALTGGRDQVVASGETVGEVLQAVGRIWPDFARQVLCGDGSLASGLCIYRSEGPLLVADLNLPVQPDEVLSLVATGEIACAIPARTNAAATTAEPVLLALGD